MSYALPHDLDKVPDGKLSVSMLDDNFDSLEARLNDLESRFTGLFLQHEQTVKRLAELGKRPEPPTPVQIVRRAARKAKK